MGSEMCIRDRACEIDVGMLAEQMLDNDDVFTAVMIHHLHPKITEVFQKLADTLNNITEEERREVEE